MDSTATCRDLTRRLTGDLTLGALTDAESQALLAYRSCVQAVVHTLRGRGHHVVVTTVNTPELGRARTATTPGLWTAVVCDSVDGYVARAYGPSINHDQTWHEEPLHISRHNAVEQFLRHLRQAHAKPLVEHLDANIAYRELFADEYRAICAAVVDYWWLARMAEGHTFESAQMLLALTLPTHLQRFITYDRGIPTFS
jgi:hypothetical protein